MMRWFLQLIVMSLGSVAVGYATTMVSYTLFEAPVGIANVIGFTMAVIMGLTLALITDGEDDGGSAHV